MKKFLLYTLLCFISINIAAQSKKTDWAQFYRYAEANDTITKRPNVVFYGNSITDFWIKKSPDFFSKHNFVDRGISGQTTSEMLVRFRQDVLNLNPKAVIILAGINDIAENNGKISLVNILGNIISMSELAKAHKIKVILCSVLPCDYFSWRKDLKPAEEVKKLNNLIYNYAKQNKIPYVDYHSALATPEGGLDERYTMDRCHPTLPGYLVMEDIVMKTIKKTIKL